jgi:hypothetical protein
MMTRFSLFGLFVVIAAGGIWLGPDARSLVEAAPPPGPHGAPEPEMLGIHWARGNAPPFGGGSDPHLDYHGGPVMDGGTVVHPIYWGTSWTSANEKIGALASFYLGVGNTSYMGTNQGNVSSVAKTVSTAVTYTDAPVIDNSAAPKRAPKTSDILAAVQRAVNSGSIDPAANGYYPVYVDAKRGGAGYCAWHSWGSVTTSSGAVMQIQFGFFFNLDGDSGCDPQDTQSGHSKGVAALGNVSAHELSEVATDPRGSAWYDRSGYENADKCAWTFNGLVAFSNGTSWKIQNNFSNKAYDTPVGSPTGCINGN